MPGSTRARRFGPGAVSFRRQIRPEQREPVVSPLTRCRPAGCSRVLRRFGDVVLDLLMGLLALDPNKRLTAEQALNHRYFKVKPLPSVPGM